MKVAIWGSYNYGNYGDDVMAIMFAQHLKKLGVTPCVYRMNQQLANQYGINTTESLDELLQGAVFGLLGGGTVLLEPLYGSVGSAMNRDTQQLWEISNAERCPLFCLSIGGDDTLRADRKLTLYQWRLLESNAWQGGTVRLQEDADLLTSLNKEVRLFPDVVLSVADFFPVNKEYNTSQAAQVGICLSNHSDTQFFASCLEASAFLRRHAVFHFIHTHLPNYNLASHSLLPSAHSAWIKHHYYEDPATTIQFISSLDLLISNKLHPTITALGLGVPSYCSDTRAKTRAVLNSLDLEFTSYSCNKKGLLRLLIQLSSRKKIMQFREKFDFQEIEQKKQLCRGHLQYLTELVEKFREQ